MVSSTTHRIFQAAIQRRWKETAKSASLQCCTNLVVGTPHLKALGSPHCYESHGQRSWLQSLNLKPGGQCKESARGSWHHISSRLDRFILLQYNAVQRVNSQPFLCLHCMCVNISTVLFAVQRHLEGRASGLDCRTQYIRYWADT